MARLKQLFVVVVFCLFVVVFVLLRAVIPTAEWCQFQTPKLLLVLFTSRDNDLPPRMRVGNRAGTDLFTPD